MQKRVALVGSSSTGKSTVFELLKLKLPKYTFISESTRTVKGFNFPINEEGTAETQLAISSFHLAALLTPGNVILDRCYLDLLVYTQHMYNPISHDVEDYLWFIWEKVKFEYTHWIYFPIEFAAVDDGVRSVNEEWRKKIDADFKYNLDEEGIHYLTVTGSPKQRVAQILDYINEG